jgi:indolepyruvate ferredoxin oxidoreductase
LELAVQLARLPERIRGYGHVKHGNVEQVRQQWQQMLASYQAPIKQASKEAVSA